MAPTQDRATIPSTGNPASRHGYAPVNGLQMYYEITGTGHPVVFIHPALGFGGLEKFPTLTERHGDRPQSSDGAIRRAADAPQ